MLPFNPHAPFLELPTLVGSNSSAVFRKAKAPLKTLKKIMQQMEIKMTFLNLTAHTHLVTEDWQLAKSKGFSAPHIDDGPPSVDPN